MSLIGNLTQFSANTKAMAAEVNQNFTDIKTAHNDLEGNAVKKDGSVAITGNLVLNNTVYLMGKDASGNSKGLAYIAGNNNINFGDQNNATYVFGSALSYHDGTDPYTIWQAKNCASSLAASGYQKLASGMIIQWGVATMGSQSTAGSWYVANGSATLPIAFPNACRQVMATLSGSLDASMFVNGAIGTTTTATMYIAASVTGVVAGKTVSYIAVGN